MLVITTTMCAYYSIKEDMICVIYGVCSLVNYQTYIRYEKTN